MGRVLLDGLWLLLVAVLTGAGVWLSSSLAAYLNGPRWLAWTLGLLAFPVLPAAWEAHAAARRARRPRLRTPFFATWERVLLRTVAVNLLVLAILLARWPAVSFAALATRGDWFLEGHTGRNAAVARVVLFRTAGALEWLHHAARPNPYQDQLARTPEPETAPAPAPLPAADTVSELPLTAADFGPGVATARAPGAPPVWPLPAQIHPAVAALPAEAERSLAGVARYIAGRERDPWLRVKALHDYVADRVAYDVEAYRSGRFPPQDAETVFRTRLSVCAGYANLLAALGAASGDEIVVVGGDARTTGRDLTGEAHAWNAARIAGAWTLLDPTWDAGHVRDGRFVKDYSTEFLFPPPPVHGLSHFPEEPRWQLRQPPLSHGEYLRQPMLRPRFFAEGFTLVQPDRPQVTVDRVLEASILNPRGRYVLAHFEPREGGRQVDCLVEQGPSVSVRCELPEEGRYRVVLFSNREEHGTYRQVGEIEALRGR